MSLAYSVKRNRILATVFEPLVRLRRYFLARGRSRWTRDYKRFIARVESGCVVICLPEFDGVFELDIRSDLTKRIMQTGNYEPELADLVRRHVDCSRDTIDVGANAGFYSVLLAKIVNEGCRVIAVEPSPVARDRLKSNLERNACQNTVSIFPGVASDREGSLVLKSVPGKEEYSSLAEISHQSVSNLEQVNVEVKSQTLDAMISSFDVTPGFVKIDTEGAEHQVLRGMRHTLRTYRPVILCEVSDTLLRNFNSTSADVVSLLEGEGYFVRDARNPRAVPAPPFEGDILALP